MRGLPRRIEALQTGEGRPLAPVWQGRLRRDWTQLQAIEARLRTLRAARVEALAATDAHVATVAPQLQQLRGLGETGATICSAEVLGPRTFRNGREVGALLGLVPVPYRSDQRVPDQGISNPGHRQVRRVASNWRGVGCAISRRVRWRRGIRPASAGAAGAVVALGLSRSHAS